MNNISAHDDHAELWGNFLRNYYKHILINNPFLKYVMIIDIIIIK
jgi:hypothetical protein